MNARLIASNLLLLSVLGGCSFDGAGVTRFDQRTLLPDLEASAESVRDRAVPDSVEAGPSDQSASFDQLPTGDLPAPIDLAPTPDLPTPDSKSVVPVSASALGQALATATVPCIDMQGTDNGTMIPVSDSATVTFFQGSVTLAGAPSALVNWVGGKPSVTVMWDPNGCDDEWPLSSGVGWSQAGFLIRGATINSSGQLVLAPGVTAADINLLDVYGNGGYEQEVFGIDDSGLASHPPLVQPVNKAKQVILLLTGA